MSALLPQLCLAPAITKNTKAESVTATAEHPDARKLSPGSRGLRVLTPVAMVSGPGQESLSSS